MEWYEALVTALSGGAVAAIGTGFFALRGKHHEQMRAQMLGAADEFATGIQQAASQLYVLYRDTTYLTAGEDLDEYARLVREAEARVARVFVLFGHGTATGRAADSALTNLDTARKHEATAYANALIQHDRGAAAADAARMEIGGRMDTLDDNIRDFADAAWQAMKRPTRRE